MTGLVSIVLALTLGQSPVPDPVSLQAGPCREVPYDGQLMPRAAVRACFECLRTNEIAVDPAATVPNPSTDTTITTFWVVGTGFAVIAAFAGGVWLGVEVAR